MLNARRIALYPSPARMSMKSERNRSAPVLILLRFFVRSAAILPIEL